MPPLLGAPSTQTQVISFYRPGIRKGVHVSCQPALFPEREVSLDGIEGRALRQRREGWYRG